MTTNQPRTAGSRLWWIIRTTLLLFIVVALITAVLGGLGYAGYLGVQELQRSADSLAMRIDANEQNLESLRGLVDAEFAKGNPEQQAQIAQMENDLAALTRRLEAWQTEQVEAATGQTENLDALEAELAAAIAQNGDLAGELETVQEALVALQSDLNNNGGRIDELGGDLDRLRLQFAELDDTLTELTANTTAARDGETADLQQTLTLLQLWGVLTNARLALIDGDATSAETAVAQAITLSGIITAEADSPTADALTRLQSRLNLAAAGFATDLLTVAQDLEAASRELTLLLSGPEPTSEIVEATPTEESDSDEETATPSATPGASETPLPSPTPTILPSATPTP